jgi:hypothetical protein
MSNVNSVLSVWQLVIMAVVPLAALCGWIITIFVVAREPRAQAAVAVLPGASATSATSASEAAAGATVGGPGQPPQQPVRRLAA